MLWRPEVFRIRCRVSLGHPARKKCCLHDLVIAGLRRNKLKDRSNCLVGARVREREDEWTGLMQSAISGDGAAYQRLLSAIAPVLRATGRRGLAPAGPARGHDECTV